MAWKYLSRSKKQDPASAETTPASSSIAPSDAIPSTEPEEIPLQRNMSDDDMAQNGTNFPVDPILSADDEIFLQRMASNFEVPPLPPGQTIISEAGDEVDVPYGADQVPLPMSPGEDEHAKFPELAHEGQKQSWTSKYWSFVPDRVVAEARNMTMPQMPQLSQLQEMAHLPQLPQMPQMPQMSQLSLFGRKTTAKVTDLEVAASEEAETTEDEQKKEQRDLTAILDGLNLSAINNRVIGVSKDSQRLLESFTVILKDIVNGVPTAYDDMERLLTERQAQLDKMYNSLPPFLQSLVQSVPTKMYAFLAPQLVTVVKAAGAGDMKAKSAGGALSMSANASSSKTNKPGIKSYIPSLKNLITQKGAAAAMLRSIISFLELRFPMLLAGTNVIMSLAVFCELDQYIVTSSC